MSGPLNPFDTHGRTQGEVVLEGRTNAPTQFIPSSFPDLAAMTSPPPSLPPAMTMPLHSFPPTAMHPAMQTRPLGPPGVIPGSFVGAPPPSMPHVPYRMEDRPGTFNDVRFGSSNAMTSDVYNSFNAGPPASFHNGVPPGSRFPPMNLQDQPGGMVHNMSWAPQRERAPDTSSFWDRLPSHGKREQDANRFQRAEKTNATLEGQLNGMTGDAWKQYSAKHFSALTKAGLEDVDWRVPRVNYCKDVKYNLELPANARKMIGQAKLKDGEILEQFLGQEAIRKCAEANPGSPMPPEEMVLKPGCPFNGVHPGYRRWDDMWERELTLRNLGESMRGDLNQPMPKPVLFGEDYQNFHQGKYLRDECPIA